MDYQLGPGPLQVDQNTIDEKIKGDIGIVENGDVATHAIPSGYYVIWKGDLYVAKTDISSGTTLSTSNLTAKPNGLGADVTALNSKMAVQTIDPSASVSYSFFSPAVCKYGNIVIGSISIVTTQEVNDLTTFITGLPAPKLNPQLPVWEFGNPSCNKRVSILASGEMQPWWNSSPGLPAGNYVIPIYYVSSN